MTEAARPSVTENWYERAQAVLPAGTFGNVAGQTILREGRAGRVWDEDGNEYVDFLIGSGPMLVGHCHPEVNAAVKEQLERGTTFFATNAQGIELAEVICDAVACAEKVRFASSGTEADMYAMRLVRAYRGREKILNVHARKRFCISHIRELSTPWLLLLAPVKVARLVGVSPCPVCILMRKVVLDLSVYSLISRFQKTLMPTVYWFSQLELSDVFLVLT